MNLTFRNEAAAPRGQLLDWSIYGCGAVLDSKKRSGALLIPCSPIHRPFLRYLVPDSVPGRPLLAPFVRTACQVFLVLAAAGLIASFTIHVLAWVGMRVTGAMSLHVGLFIVWIPTVLVSTRLTREHAQKDFWKAALRWCPRWASRGMTLLVGYAVLNFALFLFSSRLRTPTASEAESVRPFSAVWMVFYGAATAVLYSAVHAVDDRLRCPSGHIASPDALFCEKCGASVARPPPRRSVVR